MVELRTLDQEVADSNATGTRVCPWSKIPIQVLVNIQEAVACVDIIYEPPRGKTNNVVSDQVRHKPTCTVTEKG